MYTAATCVPTYTNDNRTWVVSDPDQADTTLAGKHDDFTLASHSLVRIHIHPSYPVAVPDRSRGIGRTQLRQRVECEDPIAQYASLACSGKQQNLPDSNRVRLPRARSSWLKLRPRCQHELRAGNIIPILGGQQNKVQHLSLGRPDVKIAFCRANLVSPVCSFDEKLQQIQRRHDSRCHSVSTYPRAPGK